MKKLLSLFAAMALVTSTAFAADGDFNKTGVVLEAEGEMFGIGLGTGASTDFSDEAQVLDLHLNSLPVTVGVKIVDDSTNRDYRFYASKTFDVAVAGGTAYVTPELSTTDGDSYTKRELRFAPTVGIEYPVGSLTPFAEAQYSWKSEEGDYGSFKRADSSTAVGVKVPVGTAVVSAAVVDERDIKFKRTDREAVIKVSFKF